jgi:iron complex outermembrane receptor protein
VYQNGVRINEPFGDTVNWDLIPLSAVNAVQLFPGANPVFGLNTLGGALSLQMKKGFDYDTIGAEVYGGTFARRSASVQLGGNDGRWGYYGHVDYFEEDGWRDFSASDALRFFGSNRRKPGAQWKPRVSALQSGRRLYILSVVGVDLLRDLRVAGRAR